MEDLGMVSFIIVPIESSFPNGKRCFDCEGIHRAEHHCCKVLVDVVHGRNHCSNIGCATGEEKCCIFKNLYKKVSWKRSVYNKSYYTP